MASEYDIEAALVDRLNDLTLSTPLRVSWEDGNRFIPIAWETFLVVQFLPNQPTRVTISGGEDTLQGLFQITVRGPSSRHALELSAIADEIISHFPRDLILWRNGTRVRVSEVPGLSRLGPVNGYRDAVVTVRYTTL